MLKFDGKSRIKIQSIRIRVDNDRISGYIPLQDDVDVAIATHYSNVENRLIVIFIDQLGTRDNGHFLHGWAECLMEKFAKIERHNRLHLFEGTQDLQHFLSCVG